MAARELVVLGTASQAPTRHRNHNGYLLRWDREGILFDPGEGTQRQMVLAGIPATAISRICITHFHGDHCLGLPGVLQRMSLDGVRRPVDIYFPQGGQPYFERLLDSSIHRQSVEIRPHPVSGPGLADIGPDFRLIAAPLDHRDETFGWRLEEPDGRRILPQRLEALGIAGPQIGRLKSAGHLEVRGAVVTLDEVSELRPGQRFSFIMDTRVCAAAVGLADRSDLVVCESTFLSRDKELANSFGHLTAAQAAEIADEAGARLLVLSHFSQRYPDEEVFAAEARAIFPNVIAARDLLVVPVPPRRSSP